MTRIKDECVDNALGMLKGRFSTFLGWVGNVRYYIVDGKVWSTAPGGRVARCDDPDENGRIIRMVRTLNAPKEPQS